MLKLAKGVDESKFISAIVKCTLKNHGDNDDNYKAIQCAIGEFKRDPKTMVKNSRLEILNNEKNCCSCGNRPMRTDSPNCMQCVRDSISHYDASGWTPNRIDKKV